MYDARTAQNNSYSIYCYDLKLLLFPTLILVLPPPPPSSSFVCCKCQIYHWSIRVRWVILRVFFPRRLPQSPDAGYGVLKPPTPPGLNFHISLYQHNYFTLCNCVTGCPTYFTTSWYGEYCFPEDACSGSGIDWYFTQS